MPDQTVTVPAEPRRRTISLICAFPFVNAGMMSVDAAFLSFLRRHGIDCDFRAYSTLHPVAAGPSLPFAYDSLARGFDDALTGDLIIYWGDFLHAAPYQVEMATSMIKQGMTRDVQTGVDLVEKWLYLRDADDSVLDRVIAFGGSIYTNYPDHFRWTRYTNLLDRLYGRARFVRMRDMLSAAWVDERYPQHGPSFGIDCALLLDSGAMWPDSKRPPRGKVLGVSINRSNRDAEGLTRFALTLAERLNLAPRRLAWLKPGEDKIPLDEKIATLGSCQVIFTDTYHLAISAWREGTPTLCAGRATSTGHNTLEDKKKELFHLAHQARPFYLYTEQLLQGAPPAMLDDLARLLADPQPAAFVTSSLKQRAARVERDLATAIKVGLGLA